MAKTADKSAVSAIQPDPLEPSPEEVERYIQALQDTATEDPAGAQRRAWNQIRLAGVRARERRGEVAETLNLMFRAGTPPQGLDGPTDGILVTPTMWAPGDTALRAITALWMPWAGKSFNAADASGDNILISSARLPMRGIWPLYSPRRGDDGRLRAFDFRTYVDAGRVDPDRQTLKIDYDSDENPSLLIRSILDELVELVPGAYLGKILLRRGEREDPDWQLIGYFALRPPGTARAEETA